MQRFHIGFEEDSDEYTIYDAKLHRLVGNGKGKALVLNSQDEAMRVIDILVERVCA